MLIGNHNWSKWNEVTIWNQTGLQSTQTLSKYYMRLYSVEKLR
jgi:hypothetical protein